MPDSLQLEDACCRGVEAQDGTDLLAANFGQTGPKWAGKFTLVCPPAFDQAPEPGRGPLDAIDLLSNPVALSSRLDSGLPKGRVLPIKQWRKRSWY